MLKTIAGLALAGTAFLTLASAQAAAIDPKAAHAAFAERQALCDRDRGALWGKSVCGPLLFIDPGTREIVANENTPDDALTKTGDVFTGKLGSEVLISSTTVDSRYSSRFGTTTPTPLPDRVGAARIANCCPDSRSSLPFMRPTTMPSSRCARKPRRASSSKPANRARPWMLRWLRSL